MSRLLRAVPVFALTLIPAAAFAQSSGSGDLRATIQSASPAIQQCVEASRGAGEAPPARATVTVSLSPDGQAREVRVSDHGTPQLTRCVERVVRGLRFPRRSRAARITFPLMFADP